MFFKEFLRRTLESSFGGFRLKYDEDVQRLHGEFWIRLNDAKTGDMVHEYHGTNIIVNTASILIARLLKDNTEPDAGISYLAVVKCIVL